MGVRHGGDVPIGGRAGGQLACDGVSGADGGQRDAGGIVGRGDGEPRGSSERCSYGIVDGDGGWEEHGAVVDDRSRGCRADSLRGDGVGVGHVDAVPGGNGCCGEPAGVDHGRAARGQRDSGVLCGRWGSERVAADECGVDGISEPDGGGGQPGTRRLHGEREGGLDEMRGNDVGVGHVSGVPVGAGGDGEQASVDERWRGGGEHDGGALSGKRDAERGWARQRGGDGVIERIGVGGEDGARELHRGSADGTDGVRGDIVEVGHIGALPMGSWVMGEPSALDYCDTGSGEHVSCRVVRHCGS